MTPLEFYVWTVKTLGVPSRVSITKDGQPVFDGPFKRLTPSGLKRVLARAERALREAGPAVSEGERED